MQTYKMYAALVALVCLTSTSANALKLRCTSSASILCIDKQCPESDRGGAVTNYSVDTKKNLIVRQLATNDGRQNYTNICEIKWQEERLGGFSNTVFDAIYACDDDPKFIDRGMFSALEMSIG